MTADPVAPDAAVDVAFDAVVLAGGRASRLGTPKPGLVVAGRPLLDHALAATSGARARVVVGPDGLADPERYVLTREDPPFGGPVAGIAAGLSALTALTAMPTMPALPAMPGGGPAPWVLVLACDVPRAAAMVPRLLAALPRRGGAGAAMDDAGVDPVDPVDAVDAVDAVDGVDGVDAVRAVRGGRDQWLVGLYRRSALDAAVERLRGAGGVDGAPAHRLLSDLVARTVEDDEGLTADVDTWQDAHEQDRRPR